MKYSLFKNMNLPRIASRSNRPERLYCHDIWFREIAAEIAFAR
jgi:hypothetical protein